MSSLPLNSRTQYGKSSNFHTVKENEKAAATRTRINRRNSFKASGSASSQSSAPATKNQRGTSEMVNAVKTDSISPVSKDKRLGEHGVTRRKVSTHMKLLSDGIEIGDPVRNTNSNTANLTSNISKDISFLGTALSPSQTDFGEQLEPKRYQTLFSVCGYYSAITCVPSSASIWAANISNGCIDIFSACTGKLISSFPPTSLLSKTSTSTPKTSEHDNSFISFRNMGIEENTFPKPTALHSTSTHVWIGYSNGNVAIFDHLVHAVVTEGCFHHASVVAFSSFTDGTTVSGSAEGTLVHWDCEANNFEAVTRIKNRDTSHEVLSSVCAGEACWVVLTGFESGVIHITDISNGKHSVSQRHHSRKVTSIVVLGELVFSAGEDKLVNLWRFDISPFPLTTYSLAGCGGTQIHSLRLLRQIAVQPAVCSLSLDRLRNSIWVSYVDGLIERWSAHPDDSFGVEEVIREGVLPQFSENGNGRRMTHVFPFTSVETLQILALSSNGINNIWYGHFNVLEAKVNQSVSTMNSIISQDAADTAIWREKIEGLQKRERKRKERYIFILEKLNHQRLLRHAYELWGCVVTKRRSRNPKSQAVGQKESKIALLLKSVHFKLLQRYFIPWVACHDRFKKHQLLILAAQTLESASLSLLQGAVLRKWMLFLVQKRLRTTNAHCVTAVERANLFAFISRFYFKWFLKTSEKKCSLINSSGSVTKNQLQVVESQIHRRILQRSMKKWHHAYHVLPNPVKIQVFSECSPLARFADMYEVINKERTQQVFFHQWREWAARKKHFHSLFPVSSLLLKRVQYLQVQRSYLIWKKFIGSRHIKKKSDEITQVGKQIQEIERDNKDIIQKLEYKKKIDELIVKKQQEVAELEAIEVRIEKLFQSNRILSDGSTLKKMAKATSITADRMNISLLASMSKNIEWYRGVLLQQRLLPSVLLQMPQQEALHHVMSQLKGTVINLYTDKALLLHVKDLQQSGSKCAQEIFVESFKEVKNLMMSPSRRNSRQKLSSTRWFLYMETLDSIPLHYCTPLLQAIKEMIIAFDFLSSPCLQMLHEVTSELIANADWFFLIFRACHLRRRPMSQNHDSL